MRPTVAQLIHAAEAEWVLWGRSTWNTLDGSRTLGHRDDEPPFAQRVIDAYCALAGGSPTLLQIQDDQYAWSAVGLSFVMKQAGFTAKEFPFAQAHSRWIRRFIAARRAGIADAAYWGYRTSESQATPEPGDLVAYARGKNMTAAKADKLFDATGSYESHSDLVVAKRPGAIEVIGCNVMDSVTRKTLAITGTGHLNDPHHHWFAVLRRR